VSLLFVCGFVPPVVTSVMASSAHQDPSTATKGVETNTRESLEIDHVDATGAEIDAHCESSSVKSQNGEDSEIDTSYLRASRFTRFWRSVLFQMLLFGAYVYSPLLPHPPTLNHPFNPL
jgi:hypothetical protein